MSSQAQTQATAAMKTSPAGRALTMAFEGWSAHAYRDTGGVLTIGYGHTGPDVTTGLLWTRAKGEAALAEDLREAEDCVNRLVTTPLSQNQFDALVDFTFNCGSKALATSTLLKKVNAQASTAQIQAQLRRWIFDNGRELAGLRRRRDAEAALWAGEARPQPLVALDENAELVVRGARIGPAPFVEEHSRASQSPTIRGHLVKLITLVLAAAGIGAETSVDFWHEAGQLLEHISKHPDQLMTFAAALRAVGAEHHVPLLASAAGAVITGVTVLQLYRRLSEIHAARR